MNRPRWLRPTSPWFWLALALAGVVAFAVLYRNRPHHRYRQRIREEAPIPASSGGKLPGGLYKNPVGGQIRLGDPFVLRHAGRYYLYGTRARDGFRWYGSDDLVTWSNGTYYYDIEAHPYCTRSFWAPEVHPYRGAFYLVFSCEHRGGLVFADEPKLQLALARSESPTGPFQDVAVPWLASLGRTIDPHLFVDGDRVYLYFTEVGKQDGGIFGRIRGVELEADLLRAKSAPRLLLEAEPGWEIADPNNHTNEGPFVFRHAERYYLLYSANHFLNPRYATGYAVADSPLGPFRKAERPLLSMNASLGVAGTGHPSVTRSPDGSEWFLVYHAHDANTSNATIRTVNVDRLRFTPDGAVMTDAPTRSPQPLPAGARP